MCRTKFLDWLRLNKKYIFINVDNKYGQYQNRYLPINIFVTNIINPNTFDWKVHCL